MQRMIYGFRGATGRASREAAHAADRRARLSGVVLALVLLAACGRDQSVASKSAAAYREAQARGAVVTGQDEHAGHAVTGPGAAPADDHAEHAAAGDASAMHPAGHGSSGAEHAATADHAAMGHAASDPHAAHTARAGTAGHAAMQHGGSGASMDHAQHDMTSPATRGHEGHPTTGAHAGHASPQRGSTADPHAEHGRSSGAASAPHAGHSAAQAQSSGDPHAAHRQSRGDAHAAHPQTPGETHAGHSMSPAPDPHTAHRPPTSATPDPHAAHRPAAAGVDAHAGHAMGARGEATPPPVLAAPRSSSALERLEPASTLRPDRFDAPAPEAVAEAEKAVSGGGHEGHGSHAPGTTASPADAVVYTCPMHPEVTSDRPGTCPKCGMALVKKE